MRRKQFCGHNSKQKVALRCWAKPDLLLKLN